MKRGIPWPVKIAAKLALSRLPMGYRLWKRLGLFEHGCMDRPQYALGVVTDHLARAGFGGRTRGMVALEIGPGDSLFSGLVTHALGASLTYLVDAGRYATLRVEDYGAMERHLAAQGHAVPEGSGARTMDDLLETYGIRYLTTGVRALAEIPDASVDFVWSHATLEHIRRAQFPELARQMRRVLSPDGVGSHQVDLRDHLGGALNNLRFSRRLWEADWMANSGFYTNRIGYAEMLEIFRAAGLSAEVTAVERWPELPTPRRRMAREFRARPDEDLRVSSFHVLTRPAVAHEGSA